MTRKDTSSKTIEDLPPELEKELLTLKPEEFTPPARNVPPDIIRSGFLSEGLRALLTLIQIYTQSHNQEVLEHSKNLQDFTVLASEERPVTAVWKWLTENPIRRWYLVNAEQRIVDKAEIVHLLREIFWNEFTMCHPEFAAKKIRVYDDWSFWALGEAAEDDSPEERFDPILVLLTRIHF